MSVKRKILVLYVDGQMSPSDMNSDNTYTRWSITGRSTKASANRRMRMAAATTIVSKEPSRPQKQSRHSVRWRSSPAISYGMPYRSCFVHAARSYSALFVELQGNTRGTSSTFAISSKENTGILDFLKSY